MRLSGLNRAREPRRTPIGLQDPNPASNRSSFTHCHGTIAWTRISASSAWQGISQGERGPGPTEYNGAVAHSQLENDPFPYRRSSVFGAAGGR